MGRDLPEAAFHEADLVCPLSTGEAGTTVLVEAEARRLNWVKARTLGTEMLACAC
jgi:hypothetical protein